MTDEQLIELAALPNAEWRQVASTMTYYTTHPDAEGFVLPDCLIGIYVALPTAEEWEQTRVAVGQLRSLIADRGAGDKLPPAEYMKHYMRRRRTGRV